MAQVVKDSSCPHFWKLKRLSKFLSQEKQKKNSNNGKTFKEDNNRRLERRWTFSNWQLRSNYNYFKPYIR